MLPTITALPVISVTAIFYAWNRHRERLLKRRAQLCQRVAYMLWMAANRED